MSVHWHTILTALFGWPGAWGTGGNLIAWVICGAAGGVLLRARLQAHHVALMSQAARHHKELLQQAAVHHQELKAHVSLAVADARVSEGAGSDPAAAGLSADERVVPPSATTTGRGPRRKAGGYTGGSPASEVGPPPDLPSGFLPKRGGRR